LSISSFSWNSYEIFLEVYLLWINNIKVQSQFLNDMDITPGSFEIQGFEKQPMDVTRIINI